MRMNGVSTFITDRFASSSAEVDEAQDAICPEGLTSRKYEVVYYAPLRLGSASRDSRMRLCR